MGVNRGDRRVTRHVNRVRVRGRLRGGVGRMVRSNNGAARRCGACGLPCVLLFPFRNYRFSSFALQVGLGG